MAEYFSHDYDTRSDEKIMDLMAEMNWAGYGLFWGIVELLYQNNGTMRTQYKRIAFALGSHEDSVKSVVEDFDLFTLTDGTFWSESVNKRLDERSAKSVKARVSANKRWEKQKDNANAMRTQCDSNAKKESKVKDSKVKDSKVKKSKEDIPTYSEFKEYALSKKPNVNIEALQFKYEAWKINGWKDGNDNQIKNWKSKLLNTLPHIKEQADKFHPSEAPVQNLLT